MGHNTSSELMSQLFSACNNETTQKKTHYFMSVNTATLIINYEWVSVYAYDARIIKFGVLINDLSL